MSPKNVLLICGTLNQTKSMAAVAAHLQGHRCYFTPYYCDGALRWATERGWLNFTAMGGPLRERALNYLTEQHLAIDDRGAARDYDLVITCSDLIIQKNVRSRRIVLVQEGLTEPEGALYLGARYLGLPRFLANTAAFGLSNAYDMFCVASPGYRDLFAGKGVRPEKMLVTGIPNFDNVQALENVDFPHRDYVLVCTSNARETFKYENRTRYLKRAQRIADGRQMVVKLHPGERHERATREVMAIDPNAIVVRHGSAEELIANSAVVVAQYSTVAFSAAALGKEVHSWVSPELLAQILPIQNGGRSGRNIADVCRTYLESDAVPVHQLRSGFDAGRTAEVALNNVRMIPR